MSDTAASLTEAELRALAGNSLPPTSIENIGGRVDADDIVAFRLTGPFQGMLLINNPGDQDFNTAFLQKQIQAVALPPMTVETEISGRTVTVNVTFAGAPVDLDHRITYRWDDGSPDTSSSVLVSSSSRTYERAGNFLIRVTNTNGQVVHTPVTVV
jgi:hypothetical protein